MSETCLLFVGSVNRPTPYFASANGSGLSVYGFDADTLQMTMLAEAGDIDNPTFLSVHPDGRTVYVNSEIFGWKEGLVSAFSFDVTARSLTYLNMQASLGSITAQNIIARDGQHLLAVNYGMGEGGPDKSLVVFPFADGGGLAPAVATVRHVGTGTDPERQERSHAHSVTEIGTNVFVVADLGRDTLTTYRLTDTHELVRLSETRCPPGAGPRHAVLHPHGRFLFVLNELNSTCASYEIDSESWQLRPINAVLAVPEQDRIGNHCADIQISPDGRFLYGSNRGHDSIAIFSVAQNTGEVTLIDTVPSGGRTPRNLAISPSGNHIFCANQDSDRISIFSRSLEDGGLTDIGRHLQTGTPVCVKIAALRSEPFDQNYSGNQKR